MEKEAGGMLDRLKKHKMGDAERQVAHRQRGIKRRQTLRGQDDWRQGWWEEYERERIFHLVLFVTDFWEVMSLQSGGVRGQSYKSRSDGPLRF